MEKELLKFMLDSGMISVPCTLESILMSNKNKLLESHPYSIWQGKDGYWFTYLPKPDGGRRLVKKKELASLQQTIIEYWGTTGSYKFKDRFDVWVERQRDCGRCENTINIYHVDYRFFLLGDPFEKLDVRSITSDDVCTLLNRVLSTKKVLWERLKHFYWMLKGVFEKSIIDGIIDKNPCVRVDLPTFRKKCAEDRVKTPEQRTVSKEEKQIILDKIKKYDRIERYVVEFSFYVGMRVGELVALKWEDINFERGEVIVRRSEKWVRPVNADPFYRIESTKTGKSRIVPITDEATEVLYATRDYEKAKGTYGEFVFMEGDSNVHAPEVSSFLRYITQDSRFSSEKSIHAIRRTLNSNMRHNGVSATVAASILGHSERVNDLNYTYDVSSMSEKKRVLDDATK